MGWSPPKRGDGVETMPPLGFFADKSIVLTRRLPTRADGNDLWHVTTEESQCIVRRWIREDADPAAEVAMMEQAADARIAPRVLFFDETVPAVVMAYAVGEHRKRVTEDDLEVLAAALRRLHAIETTSDLPTIDLEALIEADTPEVEAALETIRHLPSQKALCHNDLNPLNLIWHADNVTLIDFEYAGLNDPCFDLAAVSVEFDLDEEMERFWMSAYGGDTTRQRGKLAAYKVLYQALCRQWLVKT